MEAREEETKGGEREAPVETQGGRGEGEEAGESGGGGTRGESTRGERMAGVRYELYSRADEAGTSEAGGGRREVETTVSRDQDRAR